MDFRLIFSEGGVVVTVQEQRTCGSFPLMFVLALKAGSDGTQLQAMHSAQSHNSLTFPLPPKHHFPGVVMVNAAGLKNGQPDLEESGYLPR